MTRIIPIEPSIPREPKAPDNTRRAKSARQYPESQKCQTIPGEPKVQDNTRRAKSTRQYLESQLLFFFKIALKIKKWQVVYIKMFLDNYHFNQIMTKIIPFEPSIPREPKVPDNTWRANYFFFQNCFENKKVASSLHKNVLGQLPF